MTFNTDTLRTGHSLNRHLFIADNIHLLQALDNDTIDLVVTDPPFGKGRTFTSDGLKPALTTEERQEETEQMAAWGIQNQEEAREAGVEWPSNGEASYDDIWSWQDVHEKFAVRLEVAYPTVAGLINTVRSVHSDGHAAYLSYMAVRLIEIKRVLKTTGSIYLHCDNTAGHYLKLLMDAVFGRENFRNEIAWRKYGGRKSNAKRKYPTQQDTILFYGKTADAYFSPIYEPISEQEIERKYKHVDEKGRRYRLAWGRQYQTKGVQRKIYLDDQPGAMIGSLWSERGLQLNTSATERTGYPTQKPVSLAERMIQASSNPGDVVLDPFAGCAYVPVAAEGLGRQWIACDISVRAMTVVKRQFSKFRYSVDGGPVIVKQKEIDQGIFTALADAQVSICGPNQLPDRSDEDPAPPPPLVLEEPDYDGQLFKRKEMLELLLRESGWMAWCCGFAVRRPDGSIMETTGNFELDHLDPKTVGGADYIVNRAPLCKQCNTKKGARTITLRQLRDEIAAEGLLVVDSVDDLPDLQKMQQAAVRLFSQRQSG